MQTSESEGKHRESRHTLHNGIGKACLNMFLTICVPAHVLLYDSVTSNNTKAIVAWVRPPYLVRSTCVCQTTKRNGNNIYICSVCIDKILLNFLVIFFVCVLYERILPNRSASFLVWLIPIWRENIQKPFKFNSFFLPEKSMIIIIKNKCSFVDWKWLYDAEDEKMREKNHRKFDISFQFFAYKKKFKRSCMSCMEQCWCWFFIAYNHVRFVAKKISHFRRFNNINIKSEI